MNPFDIHECPEGADARTLLAYRTAVQQAFLNGASIELRRSGDKGDFEFLVNTGPTPAGTPLFDWSFYEYRVVRPKIAAGHNPGNLTEEQVGVSDGWRLLTQDEVAGVKQPGVEYWSHMLREWRPIVSTVGGAHVATYCYRTKAPAGEYLPKPKPRYFRHKTGLFYDIDPCCSDPYCGELLGNLVTFVYVSGRRVPAISYDRKHVERNLASGDWVEFDGNMAPFVTKPEPAPEPAPAEKLSAKVLRLLDQLPEGYSGRAREAFYRAPLALDDYERYADRINSPADAVLYGFLWNRTPEGWGYWNSTEQAARHGDRPYPALNGG